MKRILDFLRNNLLIIVPLLVIFLMSVFHVFFIISLETYLVSMALSFLFLIVGLLTIDEHKDRS